MAMSAAIRAERSRVWRALTDPGEIVVWNRSVIAPIDVPPEYPKPGQHARWRTLVNHLPVILHDRPIEVIVNERLRAHVAHGLFRFDGTWGLAGVPTDPARTRLTLKVVARSEIPVVGGSMDRFAVREHATRFVSDSLRAMQDHCEIAGP